MDLNFAVGVIAGVAGGFALAKFSRPIPATPSAARPSVFPWLKRVLPRSGQLARTFTRRAVVWLFALMLAFLIPLTNATTFHPFDWLVALGMQGKLTEIGVATVAMAGLSISNLLDQLVAERLPQDDETLKVMGIVIILLTLTLVTFGLYKIGQSGESHLSEQHATIWAFGIISTLCLGFIGEIVITFKKK